MIKVVSNIICRIRKATKKQILLWEVLFLGLPLLDKVVLTSLNWVWNVVQNNLKIFKILKKLYQDKFCLIKIKWLKFLINQIFKIKNSNL